MHLAELIEHAERAELIERAERAELRGNSKNEMEGDKINQLCVVLVKLVDVLERLNIVLFRVVVLNMLVSGLMATCSVLYGVVLFLCTDLL